jgi:hypothetical protein
VPRARGKCIVIGPIDIKYELPFNVEYPISDPSLYHSLDGALRYTTLTLLAIVYDVQQVCLHMHDPHEPHFPQTHSMLSHGHSSSWSHSLTTFFETLLLPIYLGDSRHSTSGLCMYLGDYLIMWSSRRHMSASRFSGEAEYRVLAIPWPSLVGCVRSCATATPSYRDYDDCLL